MSAPRASRPSGGQPTARTCSRFVGDVGSCRAGLGLNLDRQPTARALPPHPPCRCAASWRHPAELTARALEVRSSDRGSRHRSVGQEEGRRGDPSDLSFLQRPRVRVHACVRGGEGEKEELKYLSLFSETPTNQALRAPEILQAAACKISEVSRRMGPPGRLKASLGPTEEQAIATEFVSRGSRLSPLAHRSRHVAPGRVRRARGGHGATWPTEGTEAKRGGLRRRRRCCAAERSFTHEANCQRDRRSAPPCRGDARVPVRTRRGRRHQATRVAGALRARGRATADRMEQAQRGGDPGAWTPLDARCRALPRDQRALPVGDLVAARSRPVRPHAERRALRPGRPEAGGRALQASTINGGNG